MRIAHRNLAAGSAKSEARILVAAMPQRDAESLMLQLPSAGIPAARALDLSEVAVLNAFQNDPALANREDAFGLIHIDHEFSLIALFNAGVLSHIRIFPFGAVAVLQKIMHTLNVDQPTAEGVLTDGAFDISHLIEEGFCE